MVKILLNLFIFLSLPLVAFEKQELSMQQMWQMVIQNHEAIKVGELDNYQACLDVKQTVRHFFPNIAASASLTFSNPTEAVDGSRLIPTSFRAASLLVNQPLFDMRFRPALKGAKYFEQATEARTEFELYEILYMASEVYFGLLQAESLLKVSYNQLNLLENQLTVTQERYENGEIPVTDLLRSEEAVKQAQRTVNDVMSDLCIYEERLTNFLGVDSSCFTLSCEGDFPFGYCESLDGLIGEAISRRLDLKSTFAAIEAAKMRLKTEKRNNWPKLDFIGEYVLASPETLAYRNNSYSAGFLVTLPLSDSGRNCLNVKNLTAEIAKQELAASRLCKDIQVQVKGVYYELESARANFSLLEKELDIARENYQILSERYEKGLTSNIDQLNALYTYIQAEANFTSARYNLMLLQLKLKKETGLFDELVTGREC